MGQINTAGKHRIIITAAVWAEAKAGNGYIAHITGALPNGDEITHYQAATSTLVKNGKNAGTSMFDVSMELLQDIGMEGDLTTLETLVGKPAIFVCDFEPDKDTGQPRLRVKFLNPAGRAAASQSDVGAFFDKMGHTKTAATPAAAPVAQPVVAPVAQVTPNNAEDEIPI